MLIRTAKTAGFCFGVQRAVDATLKAAEENRKVYTWGPVVHNEHVIEMLKEKGVSVLNSEEELSEIPEDSVIVIRAHGIGEALEKRLSERGFSLIDATCPFVKKIHRIAAEAKEKNDFFLIAGDASHPEVQGICGWAPEDACVISSEEEITPSLFPENRKITVVSQTTFNFKKFENILDKIRSFKYNANVANTICNATKERQEEARQIASESDLMLVIGSPNSSNSQKLYDICKRECSHTNFIQSRADLQKKWFQGVKCVGITAGASTPKNILEEVQTMSESFEQMLEASLKTIKNGEVVTGTVIAVKENEIVLNIGYKADGIIAKSEYTNDSNADLTALVNVGDEIEAKILRVNDGEGQVQLSTRKMRVEKSSQILEDAFENHTVLTAVVDQAVKGGLSCTVDEVKVFIPASLVSDVFEKDLTKYEGQEIQFALTEYNPKRHRVIGDRKSLIVAEKQKALDEVLSRITIGDIVEGTVKNVTDFGVFIDLGGADGLLHISEMSWGRIEAPKKVFKTGDTVRVFVKSIDGSKIALSKKFPDENPWADAETRFAVGNVVEGVVARLTDFGAFVELAKGVDGLLHVSQIKRERVEKPSDVLEQGQTVTVKIVDLDLDNKKISLSMKALLPKPERAPRPERRRNERPEDSYTNADGTVNIEAYAAKMAADDAKKAAEEATEE